MLRRQILRRLRDRGMHCADRRAIPQKHGKADDLTRAENDVQQKIHCSRQLPTNRAQVRCLHDTIGTRLLELRNHHHPQQQSENSVQVEPLHSNRCGPGIVHQADDADRADRADQKSENPSARVRATGQLDRSNRGQFSPPCKSLLFGLCSAKYHLNRTARNVAPQQPNWSGLRPQCVDS
jgi:hypothetical protein